MPPTVAGSKRRARTPSIAEKRKSAFCGAPGRIVGEVTRPLARMIRRIVTWRGFFPLSRASGNSTCCFPRALGAVISGPTSAVRALTEAVTHVGARPQIAAFQAASELAWYAEQGIPGVIFGPGRITQAHGPDEYVETAQLIAACQTMALPAATGCGAAATR